MSLELNLSTIRNYAVNAGAWSNLTPIHIQLVLEGPSLIVTRLMYFQATPEHPLGRIVLVPEQQEQDTPQEIPQS